MRHYDNAHSRLYLPAYMAVALVLMAALFMVPRPARCQEPPAQEAGGVKTVEASGTAVIKGGNTALARDSAISDALRKAVEQAVGLIVSSDTAVKNYQLLEDNVYTRTQGYVKDYSITGESISGGTVNVSVRATIATGPLEDDLAAMGLLQKKVERPRVLFMIAEKNIGHRRYVFWWWGRTDYMGEVVDISAADSTLKEVFLKKGFNVVDISGSAATFSTSDAFRVADLTQTGARSIGKRLNADVVVYGKAVAMEGPRTPDSSVGTYIADVVAEAVRVDDGVVLGSGLGHATSRSIAGISGGTEAISKASVELAERLTDQITAAWSGPQNVTLRIKGISDYRDLATFKKSLKGSVRGVGAIFQRSFSDGEAVLEVEGDVSAQKLADGISAMDPSYRVTGTTKDSVEVTVDGDGTIK